MRNPTPLGTAGLEDPHGPVISNAPVNMHPSFDPFSPLHFIEESVHASSRRTGEG